MWYSGQIWKTWSWQFANTIFLDSICADCNKQNKTQKVTLLPLYTSCVIFACASGFFTFLHTHSRNLANAVSCTVTIQNKFGLIWFDLIYSRKILYILPNAWKRCRATNIKIMQSGRFYSPIRKIFKNCKNYRSARSLADSQGGNY